MKSLIAKYLFVAAACCLMMSPLVKAQAPANDNCPGATVIGSIPYHATQNTRLATPNGTDPALGCADGGGGKTVWYKYTADSTRFLTFTSVSSTPSDYDIAFGLYSGSCGSLVELDCNDDISPGSIRQSAITYQVQAGVTYILQVAEWNGGGPSGGVPTGGDLVLDVMVSGPPPPIALGPKSGSVLSGAIVSTNSFGNVPLNVTQQGEIDNERDIPDQPTPADVMPPAGPPGSNHKEDVRGVASGAMSPSSRPAVLTNFQANNFTGSFPPDPIMAVGPNHVISCVNSSFQIRDKNGTLLKNIGLSAFFNAAAGGGVGFSDPEIIYDHFANRWVIAGGDFSAPYNLLIGVSDDSDPLGTWYTWSLPAGLGDSATGNLPDYPQLGYDSLALYLTTRDFGASFYSRVRIIEKTQLYANTAGPVSWNDIWDIREPQHTGVAVDGIRPSEIRGTPGVHFLVATSPYGTGTFFSVWTIHDPVGTPSLTGANVPVIQFATAPNPGQLGGGIPFEGGGRAIRHRAVYRDSSLWMVHSVASGTGNAFSSIRYVRLNPFTNTSIEDEALGSDGFWFFYPSLMVNDSGDVMVTCTRSGNTEYAGAFLAGRKASDPPGLSSSIPVKQGLANYQLIQSPNRNRWGDYLGIGLDPADGKSFWAVGEFAAGTSNWGTWVVKTQMAPVAGKAIFSTTTDLSFIEREINHVGDTLLIPFTNNGLDTLVISSLTSPDSNFAIIDPPSLPLSVPTFGVETLKVRFNPKTIGSLSSSLVINSNDTYNPNLSINLAGLGYHIAAAQSGIVYGGTGLIDFGRLITINPITGAGTPIGQTGFEQLTCLKIHPITHELWGLLQLGSTTHLLRVNSEAGDAHIAMSIPYTTIEAMTFRGDTMYMGRANGTILRLDLSNGNIVQIASTGLKLDGLDFNPVTGELWASNQISSPVDRIFKINLAAGGTPTLVGRTNFNVQTLDISFDGAGNLFGVIGTGPQQSNLILIDTLTGSGTIVGNVGPKPVQGLAFDPAVALPVHSFRFANDWNLFSVPVQVSNYATKSLFPTALSKAFAFQGKYIERDSVKPGEGYWLKFNSSYVKSVIGDPIDNDSVDINPSWNLLGSVSGIVPVSSLVTIPAGIISSSFYTYDSGGYIPLDSLLPGYGHWVKANAAGKIVLDAPVMAPRTQPYSVDRIPVPTSALNAFNGLHSLTLQDAVGHTQRLYFGSEAETRVNPSRYELPPASPDGFDMRFASNRMVELHPASLQHAMEFPLRIQSLGRSVNLSWKIETGGPVHYALVFPDQKGGSTNIAELRNEGNMTIPTDRLNDIRLRAYETLVPQGFSLLQNYPNPFNPVTNIRYELPSNGYVHLAVYDVVGRLVATLVDGMQEAGYYDVPFDAGNLASGIYFYRLNAGAFTSVQKMTVLK